MGSYSTDKTYYGCADWFSSYRFDAEVKVLACRTSNDRVKSRLKAALSESNAGLDEIIKTFEIVDAANSVEEVIKLRGRWCHRPVHLEIDRRLITPWHRFSRLPVFAALCQCFG